MGPIRKRRSGRRHKKLKAIDPFYSGPRKLLIDKFVVLFVLLLIFGRIIFFSFIEN